MVRITVVNDNPELLDLLGDILGDDGYSTTLIESPDSEVLQRICRSEPDLLILDLRHGTEAVRGWEIVQELRSTAGCEDLPVVISSTDLEALSRVQQDFLYDRWVVPLRVPFHLGELERSIGSLVQRRAYRCS